MNNDTQIVIIGLGLLGASLANALRTHGYEGKIIGVSREHTHAIAKESELFDELFTYDQIELFKSKGDLFLVCLPLQNIKVFLSSLSESEMKFKSGAILTDVGSAKKDIQDLGIQLFDQTEACFIGGHPMAGSQKSGFEARDPLLYESALWILTRPEQLVKAKASLLIETIKLIGSKVVYQSDIEHDRRLARVSHLPQLISTLLASTQRRDPSAIELSGPGFRDMTRLAESSFAMWDSILKQNQKEILDALKEYQIDLVKLINDLEYQPDQIESLFREGAAQRAKIPERKIAADDNQVGILVTVPNKPGMIGKVVSPLSEAHINIVDIELLKNREGLGGTLRISVLGKEQADNALNILNELEIIARIY